MGDHMTPTCPYCGAEMVVEGETIEDVSGSILLLGGWCLCEKCGSRSPYVNAADDAQLEERALSAAMQRYVEPNRVLELEEVKTLSECAVWLEHRDGHARFDALRGTGENSASLVSGFSEWLVYYNETWRLWLRRPTDEERQSMAWEESQ